MSTLTSLLDDKASRITDQMDGLGREAAGTLHAVASSIRRRSKAIDHFVESTANRLDGAGTYVEKHNMKQTMGESRRLLRRYPLQSLVLAAAVGVLTSLALLRLTYRPVNQRVDVFDE